MSYFILVLLVVCLFDCMQLNFIQYNLHLFAGTVVPIQLKDAERRDCVCAHILNTTIAPDVVSLVEIWSDDYKDKMIDCVKDTYPYSMDFRKKDFFKIGSGLLLLSKYPLTDPQFIAYSDLDGWDDMSQKGIGAVVVELNDTSDFRVFWTHTQAGKKSEDVENRSKNLAQALKFTQTYNPSLPAILLGDLNLGLNQTYVDEYKVFIANYSEFYDSFGEDPIDYTPTVDSVTNVLAERWCGSDCSVQRDDFLMYNPVKGIWKTNSAGVVHDWFCSLSSEYLEIVDCSDHYPIYASLEYVV